MEMSKERYRALYLYQNVFISQIWPDEQKLHPLYLTPTMLDYNDNWYLSLRGIAQLSESEAMVVANLFDLSDEAIAETNLQEWIEALFSETAGYYIDGYTGNQLLSVIDYLRSIGICLDNSAVENGYCVVREDGV